MRTLILIALMAAPASGLAQGGTSRLGLEAGVLHATVDGSDFDGTDAGNGFQLGARLRMPNFSVGAGFLRTSHGVDGLDDPLIISGFIFEPRYSFAASGTMRPFVQARFGLLSQGVQTFVAGFGDVDIEGSGNVMGVGGGVTFSTSPHVELNLVAAYNKLHFGEVTINGAKQSGSGGDGSSVTLQFALTYVLGKAARMGARVK